MQYEVTEWRGHPNVHCPWCPFATVSDNGQEVVAHHTAQAHPTQLRQALAAEMATDTETMLRRQTKKQLLARATELELEIDPDATKAEIAEAIASAEATSADEQPATDTDNAGDDRPGGNE